MKANLDEMTERELEEFISSGKGTGIQNSYALLKAEAIIFEEEGFKFEAYCSLKAREELYRELPPELQWKGETS
jgi:hypothetical protein